MLKGNRGREERGGGAGEERRPLYTWNQKTRIDPVQVYMKKLVPKNGVLQKMQCFSKKSRALDWRILPFRGGEVDLSVDIIMPPREGEGEEAGTKTKVCQLPNPAGI